MRTPDDRAATASPGSREIRHELSREDRHALPGELTTLASAAPGQVVEVRTVLRGAGAAAAVLRAGDRVICRDRQDEWLVVALHDRGELTIHRREARCVQIERGARAPEP